MSRNGYRGKIAAACILVVTMQLAAAADNPVAAFSAMRPGGAIEPWQRTLLRGKPATQFELIKTETDVVIEARSTAAVAALSHNLNIESNENLLLEWRWKIDRLIATSDISRKDGDDYPARVYISFDYDVKKLPFVARIKLGLGRLIYGDSVPAAAICYVWDRSSPVGTMVPNAYTDQIKMIVVESGPENVGSWVTVSRNIAQDYLAAFGEPASSITGVAIATDTDNTGESTTAWFGDVRLRVRDKKPQ